MKYRLPYLYRLSSELNSNSSGVAYWYRAWLTGCGRGLLKVAWLPIGCTNRLLFTSQYSILVGQYFITNYFLLKYIKKKKIKPFFTHRNFSEYAIKKNLLKLNQKLRYLELNNIYRYEHTHQKKKTQRI